MSSTVLHNECLFSIVRYFEDKAVIKIQALQGVFLSGEATMFITESVDNLTTNFGGGFEEWVKDKS